ncbi:hypothetical protein Naga_100674g3 [Nannochloropsis gaditana]|uniref:Uncharacterized protein n=1 Tax=Nannochloropsis gaditana TaxID=72520 RepID=W7TJZ8_9STRA|nr:hypothetical protein Naga_100674g3 [Nannochloropsis gaditana]
MNPHTTYIICPFPPPPLLRSDPQVYTAVVELSARLVAEPKVLTAVNELLLASSHKVLEDPQVVDHSKTFVAEVVADDALQRTGQREGGREGSQGLVAECLRPQSRRRLTCPWPPPPFLFPSFPSSSLLRGHGHMELVSIFLPAKTGPGALVRSPMRGRGIHAEWWAGRWVGGECV